ncbi:hypothetical protein WMY93_021747 [Mugilogobius chulae]|uniref:c-SKI SMAD4-binding domain-containing protein n=1 Tax=Mugilogobius chulae TaxID=88201 RepID=A0AAW0NBI9_9GOBI
MGLTSPRAVTTHTHVHVEKRERRKARAKGSERACAEGGGAISARSKGSTAAASRLFTSLTSLYSLGAKAVYVSSPSSTFYPFLHKLFRHFSFLKMSLRQRLWIVVSPSRRTMDKSLLSNPNDLIMSASAVAYQPEPLTPPRGAHIHTSSSSSSSSPSSSSPLKPNQVGQVVLYGVPIVSLVIDNHERLCLAQISNTLLKNYSYNEIHNRRVALGITCVQCTPVQLEILRRAGAMPISSRRCGMITKREAERLCKSFLGENAPPKLPDNFAFDVSHECAWGCRGNFIPARYNSSRAKCIKCALCNMYFSPNKFIFHSHRTPESKYMQPDAANFNSWRRHLKLSDKQPPEELVYAWEDVKAMFNGGSRKRALPSSHCSSMGPIKSLPASVHMMAPDLAQKRGGDDDDLDCDGLSPRKTPRSYPIIPVPTKKEDSDVSVGQKGAGLSGLLWPGRKDTFYPPFCMFWPPRAAGGIPVPTYLQPQPNALSLTENPSLRQAFLDLSDPSEPGNPGNAVAASISAGTNNAPSRKPSYGSAFRPVVKDPESVAKLHGVDEDFGSSQGVSSEQHRNSRLSPGGSSCSYESVGEEAGEDSEEEEPEVDVESPKHDEPQEQREEQSCSRTEARFPPLLLLRHLLETSARHTETETTTKT